MKTRFRLTPSNKVYAFIVAAFFIGLFIVFAEKDAYQTGALAGRLTTVVLFPLLAAGTVWFFSRRNERWTSLAFNIVLTLVALGHFGKLRNERPASRPFTGVEEIQEMHTQKDVFKKTALKTDDPIEYAEAYGKFSDSVQQNIDSLAEKSSGTEQQIWHELSDFFAETQSAAQTWMDSYNAVLDPSILDYSLLTSDDEFDRQQRIVTEYIEQTKTYQIYFADLVPNLKGRLIAYGENEEAVKGVLKGATTKFQSRKRVLEPSLQAHIEYGNLLIKILDFLRENKEEWDYENDELIFDSDERLEEYNKLIESLTEVEKKMDTLSRQATTEM